MHANEACLHAIEDCRCLLALPSNCKQCMQVRPAVICLQTRSDVACMPYSLNPNTETMPHACALQVVRQKKTCPELVTIDGHRISSQDRLAEWLDATTCMGDGEYPASGQSSTALARSASVRNMPCLFGGQTEEGRLHSECIGHFDLVFGGFSRWQRSFIEDCKGREVQGCSLQQWPSMWHLRARKCSDH
eukprot:1154368-Pelagomonas_calceolata.AAC.2